MDIYKQQKITNYHFTNFNYTVHCNAYKCYYILQTYYAETHIRLIFYFT